MNWEAWTPAIISLVGAIFVAGKTAGRINDQETAIKRHDDILKEHDEMFDQHGGRLSTLEAETARVKAWHEGYKAAQDASH